MEELFLPNQQQNTTTSEPITRNKWDGYEFFICMLPSYIFCVFGLIRYYEIRHLGHPKIEPDFRPYHIVKWLSCGMAGTYVLKALLLLIYPSIVNQERDDAIYFFLYGFPVVAWYWAYWLTLMEVKRKVMPLDHNQLMLWSLSALVSFVKMVFENKTTRFELFFDFVQFCLSGMTTYQYCKHSEEFFRYMEEFAEGPTIQDPLSKSDFLAIEMYKQKSPQKVIPTLPEIKIHISKKIHQRKTGPELMEHFFEIHREINKKKLDKVERSLKEFIDLHEELKLVYSLVKFPRMSAQLPELDTELVERFVVEKNPADHYEMVAHLENYLNGIVLNPIYMHEVVLDFLQIREPFRKPFLLFFKEAEQRNSASPKDSLLVQRIGSKSSDIEMGDIVSPTKKIEKKLSLEKNHSELHKIHLEVYRINIRNRPKKKILYEFRLDLIKENDAKVCWMIAKSLDSFKKNHQGLEKYLGIKVPAPKRFLPEVGEEHGHQYWEAILIGLEKYLKTILSVKKFYCPILFDFLGLDTQELRPKDSTSELNSGSSIAEEDIS